MKTSIAIATITILLAACGMSSAGNEAVGQVKKVVKKTPLICSDYTEADISLGVLRNGVGSMSKEDVVLAVDNDSPTIATLKRAAESGALVKFTYDVKRWPAGLCWPVERLLTVEIETAPAAEAK